MITSNRTLLFTKDERLIASLAKFEAIESIAHLSEVEKVWRCNKTPIILSDDGGIMVPDFNVNGTNFEKEFTAWAYENGIEPGELSRGMKFNSEKEPCILCAIGSYRGGTKSAVVYNRTVEKEVDCIVYESDNFYVASEKGALKKGFLMIVPKSHILSVAQFPEELYQEYKEVSEDIEQILVATFGYAPVAFFEHGSGPSGMTSHPKSIVHAHTHVLHDWAMKKSDLERIQAKPLDEIKKASSTHYFAYKSGAKGQRYVCYDNSVFVPRQYARQIIAMEMGYTPEQYNWRHFDFRENVHTTLYYIWRKLKWTTLSDRISNRTECFVIGYRQRDDFFEN